jgi:hypothetical protein
MRKKILKQESEKAVPVKGTWLDVKQLARVEVTSEEVDYPIENAFEIQNTSSGWRASEAGKQTIRIIFDEPQRIQSIFLHFNEEHQARTQEFVLSWSPDEGQTNREIVRQQYNFSPESSMEEREHYTVNLDGVKVVELVLLADLGGGSARASLSGFRLARTE